MTTAEAPTTEAPTAAVRSHHCGGSSEQLKALYCAAELDQLYEIAAALELEPWLHLVRSQRRFDDALHAKSLHVKTLTTLNESSVNNYREAQTEFRCAIEQLKYALIGAGVTFEGKAKAALTLLGVIDD